MCKEIESLPEALKKVVCDAATVRQKQHQQAQEVGDNCNVNYAKKSCRQHQKQPKGEVTQANWKQDIRVWQRWLGQ